jgi:hypothetical protein
MLCEGNVMLPEFVGARLKPLTVDLPPSWQLWQHKSLNMHRGVIYWDATSATPTLFEIRDQVRSVVRDHFRPSWWRGFGFGAIISLNHVDDAFKDAADLVDVRNNRKGVWQWLVLHYPKLQSATGICTWRFEYLRPVYQDLLSALQDSGFACASQQKDMDALAQRLFALHRAANFLRSLLRVLGG